VEFVWVVKRDALFDDRYPHGFLSLAAHDTEVARYVERARSDGFFVERRFAEEDPSLQQIIPYVIMRRGDEILLLRRSKAGGDARLHDKLSIGVGGHVNPPDAEHDDLIGACARREIDEEVEVTGEFSITPIGAINDDSNPVGAVHFGLVFEAQLPADGDVRVRETELLEARWTRLDELLRLDADADANLETWSGLIARGLADDVEGTA